VVESWVLEEGAASAKLLAPGVVLDRDRTVVMDAREARPIDVGFERSGVTFAGAAVGFRADGPVQDVSSTLILFEGQLDGFAAGQIGPEVGDDVLSTAVQGTWFVPEPGGDWRTAERFYELAWFEHGRMITGLDEQVRDDRLGTARTTYRRVDPGTVGGLFSVPRPRGGEVVVHASRAFPAPLPVRRTVLYTPGDVEWLSDLWVERPDPEGGWGEPIAGQQGRARRFRAGRTSDETWNAAVFGPNVQGNPFVPELALVGPLRRRGDTITASPPMHGDGEGRAGWASLRERTTTVLRDGEPVPGNSFEGYAVPPEEAGYRVEVDATRDEPARLSTRVTAAWTFRSGHVDGDAPAALPALAVRCAPPLDSRNRAAAGSRIDVPVAVDHLGDVGTVGTPTVEVSVDDGATWAPVPVRRGGGGQGWVASIQNPRRSGFVSLRTGAADDRGNAVEQTVVRAYEVTTAR
jgi:hypothetical protein